MARYNAVQIGSVYLTSTGAAGGLPCKTTIKGLESMKTSKTGQALISADGTPYLQVIDVDNRGIPVEITTDWMSKTVFDSVVALIESAINSASSIALVINGDTGNFSFNAVPAVPEQIFFQDFRNNYIRGAGFKFIRT
jgi:hypothetical protein